MIVTSYTVLVRSIKCNLFDEFIFKLVGTVPETNFQKTRSLFFVHFARRASPHDSQDKNFNTFRTIYPPMYASVYSLISEFSTSNGTSIRSLSILNDGVATGAQFLSISSKILVMSGLLLKTSNCHG